MNPTTKPAYSGIVIPGKNETGSYDRLQYKITCNSMEDIEGAILEALGSFKVSPRSRLDMRINCNLDQNQYMDLTRRYPLLEKSFLTHPSDSGKIIELTLCHNKSERSVPQQTQKDIRARIQGKIAIHTISVGDYSAYMDRQLDRILGENLCVGIGEDHIAAKEIQHMWGKSFGWDFSQCQGLQDTLDTDRAEGVYVLRTQNRDLVAALLIQGGESTEWFVNSQFRGQNMMLPLLIMAHANHVMKNPTNPLYGHLRWNRSLGLGLRSGMKIPKNTTPLWNHVSIGGENPEPENIGKPVFSGVLGRELRTFVSAQLDHTLFSSEILAQVEQILTL